MLSYEDMFSSPPPDPSWAGVVRHVIQAGAQFIGLYLSGRLQLVVWGLGAGDSNATGAKLVLNMLGLKIILPLTNTQPISFPYITWTLQTQEQLNT